LSSDFPFFIPQISRTAITITLDACEQALSEKIFLQLTVPDYKKQRLVASSESPLAEYKGEHLGVKGNAEGVFGGQEKSDSIRLNAEALLLIESNRNLV